jgi:hypothetical protein
MMVHGEEGKGGGRSGGFMERREKGMHERREKRM